MPPRHRLIVAGLLSLFVLAAKLRPLHPLRDAVTGAPAAQFSLDLPSAYVLTTPLSALADLVTLNSARQDQALAVYLIVAYWVWFAFHRWRQRFVLFSTRAERRSRRLRALLGFPVYLVLVALFLAWALLSRRPAAALVSADKDDLVLDLHSHTSYSWDGRKGLRPFTPEENIRWHRRLGFSAGFVTDHNVVAGAREAKALSRKRWKTDGFRALEGEEVSLHDTHVVVLGNRFAIDNRLYDQDLGGLFRFFRDAPKFGGLTLMSLPEYWRHHPESRWPKFADAGAAGFEIVTASPKAMDFPPDARGRVAELCRKRRRFVAAATDGHGWGSAAAAWNVMRLPGHAAMDPDKLEREVLSRLRSGGADALRVIARTTQTPPSARGLWLDPLLEAWTFARTFTRAQVFVCLLWIWSFALFFPSLDI